MRIAACLSIASIVSIFAACSAGSGNDGATSAEARLGAGTYELGSVTSPGKCLDVSGAGSADGTNIQQWQCNGTGAQSFRVEPVGGGAVRIVNTPTGKCVDVSGAGSADGTNVQLWTCNGTDAQSFRVDDVGGGNVRIVNTPNGKCVDVAGADTADGANVQLWTCNGTVAQLWRPSGGVSTPPVDAGAPSTDKIVGGYYPNWTPSPVRIRDVDPHYNLIYLFVARPVGGSPGTTGEITFDMPGDGRGAASHLKEDIAYARSTQHRKIVLSVGGAGGGMSFPNRTKSTTFVNSVSSLYAQLGGFDGLDWNTFEGSQAPDTSEMIWMSLELKNRYPGFLITAPPAPWNAVDKTFCAQMVAAGALDYAAPQYYDGPNLATKSYIESSVAEWSNLVGAERLVVGFGIWDQPNYMAIGDAVATWQSVKASHPDLRGAFDWQIHIDESQGWPFANRVGPLVTP